MKKLAYKAFIVLFCALLIIPVIPIMKTDAAEPSIYYCREALKSLPDGEKLVYAYDSLVAGIAESKANIQVYNGHDDITIDEFKIVFDAYRRDHTEQFWLGSSYNYSYFGSTVTSISPEYIMSGEKLDDAKAEFESAADGILEQLSPEMSDYEKEKKLHDILAARCVYVESENAHNAYGALVQGKAVCEGYAEAMQYLLQRAGIQSLLVFGSSKNPTSGANEPHAWNMVRIDGKYYHLDLTWNDQSSHLYYAYFNLTDSVITKDHIIDDTAYALPSCTATASNYFVKEGVIISSYTAESVAQLLSDHNLTLRAYIPDGRDEFISWLITNISSIAAELDITGPYGYSYSSLGNEIIVIIDTCQHKYPSLVQRVDPTCSQNGMEQHYECSCGKLFSDPQAKNEIIDTSQLILVAGHSWTLQIEDDAHIKNTPASCAEYYTYFYGCKECGAISKDKFYTSNKTLPHSPVLVEGIEPTCSTHGKSAYYKCSCGACFEDAEATLPIRNESAYGRIDKVSHREINSIGRCSDCGDFIELTPLVTSFGLTVGFALIIAPIIVVNLARLLELFKIKPKSKSKKTSDNGEYGSSSDDLV